MPYIEVNNINLHYLDEGAGPETILFSHGLLFSSAMFEKQIAHFKDHYRCIAYDHRGQGESEVTTGGYDMDTLASDAQALIKTLDIGPCHFVGLSMGGFVGMRLGVRNPELLRSLILIETTADSEPAENLGRYRMLNFIARWFGISLVVGKVMPIMFGSSFLNDISRVEEKRRWRRQIGSNDRVGISRAVAGVVNRDDFSDAIKKINLPTLILVGEEDVATVPEKSERMHNAISGSKLVRIQKAGHSSTIEQPEAVNTEMELFLRGP